MKPRYFNKDADLQAFVIITAFAGFTGIVLCLIFKEELDAFQLYMVTEWPLVTAGFLLALWGLCIVGLNKLNR